MTPRNGQRRWWNNDLICSQRCLLTSMSFLGLILGPNWNGSFQVRLYGRVFSHPQLLHMVSVLSLQLRKLLYNYLIEGELL